MAISLALVYKLHTCIRYSCQTLFGEIFLQRPRWPGSLHNIILAHGLSDDWSCEEAELEKSFLRAGEIKVGFMAVPNKDPRRFLFQLFEHVLVFHRGNKASFNFR